MAENKVQFNLKNVHYAVATAEGWSTPVAVPGAVSLSLSPEGETNTFYADGLAYYVAIANNGYSGDLEMAKFPDAMMSDIWGFTEDSKNVMVENSLVEGKAFALLFQIDGDQGSNYYVLYNCSAARPSISARTNTNTKDVQTQTTNITASPMDDGKVFARTTATTEATVKNAWFSSVYNG